MRAAWMWGRADLRRRWASILVLAALVGLAGAVVLAGAAGARRTASANDRFLAESRAADVYVFPGEVTQEQIRKFSQAPFITAVAPAQTLQMALPSGAFPGSGAPLDGRFGNLVERARILEGRRADPTAPNELVVAEPFARRYRLHVGGSFVLHSYSPDQVDALKTGLLTAFPKPRGPTVRMHIVGIGLLPSDLSFSGAEGGILVLTPAFLDRYGARIGSYVGDVMAVRLRHGTADLPEFVRRARTFFGDADTFDVQPLGQTTAAVQQSIDLLTLGTAIFALVASIAGLTAIGLAFGRRVDDGAPDQHPLGALGLTRSQRALAVLVPIAPAIVLGAVIAVFGAWLASPLMPMGLAGDAEPNPGLDFDALVLALGFVAIVVTLFLIVGTLAWRAAREPSSAGVPKQTTAAARATESLGVGPVFSTGVRMALERGSGRRRVPVRSALLGTVVAVLGVTGVTVFAASLDRIERTPALYGFNWDARVIDGSIRPSVPGHPCTVKRSRLTRVGGVGEVASICSINVELGGRPVVAFGVIPIRGAVEPTIVEGRAPRTAREVALGAHSLSALGLQIGDHVRGAGARGAVDYRIVGVAASPRFNDQLADPVPVDDGAFFTGAGLDALDDPTDVDASAEILIRVADGADRHAVLRRVERLRGVASFDGGPGVGRPNVPLEVERVQQVDALPAVLAGFLAVLGMMSVGFVLASSTRRRSRDLAVLKTLGFLRRQISGSVAWQATTIAAIGVLIGVPLGIVAGRAAWRAVADSLGVVSSVAVPVGLIVIVGVAAILLANALAAGPGWVAARTRPARVLRSE